MLTVPEAWIGGKGAVMPAISALKAMAGHMGLWLVEAGDRLTGCVVSFTANLHAADHVFPDPASLRSAMFVGSLVSNLDPSWS